MVLSFQKRLLLGVILLVFTTTATLALVGVRLGSTFLRTRFEDRMNFLARYLALNAELGILLKDQAILQGLAGNLLTESDVTAVMIKNRDEEILAEAGRPEIKKNGVASAAVMLSQREEGLPFRKGSGNSRLLGEVRIFYSTSGIDALLFRMQSFFLIAGLVLTLAGLMCFFFFSRTLMAPLKELVSATRLVAQGDLNSRVQGGSIPEIRQLADAFNNMLTSLLENRRRLEETYKQIMQQKSLAEVGHFALTVAHEVKNPLGIIRGALDVLKKPEVDSETKSTMIAYMEDEIMRLNRLIQDFLTFSRPRKPVFKRTDLNLLVQNLVERNRLEWEEKNVRLRCQVQEGECYPQADEDLLSQAMLNVLRNACESCEGNGQVEVSTAFAEEAWTVEICDNGKGMPDEVKRKACEPFFTTKSSGTGLGLAFVERVMKAHDGDVIITDSKLGGTAVRLILPIRN
ncbi:MAG: ATP-binding protein [Desulfobulbaceae bacterium]|nr:ATP-binding protein [Desulfobulbaceae bacterium]